MARQAFIPPKANYKALSTLIYKVINRGRGNEERAILMAVGAMLKHG
jgi:hypothetical protein